MKKLSLLPIFCCFSVVSTAYATNSFLEKKPSSNTNTSMDFFLQAGSQGIVSNDQNSGNLTDDNLKYPVLFNLGYTYDYNGLGTVEMELVESDIVIRNNKYNEDINQVVLRVEPNKVTYITPILKLFASNSKDIYTCKFKYPIKIKTDSTDVIATSVDTGKTLFTRGITLDVDYLECDNSGKYRSVYLETTGEGNRYYEFTPNHNAHNVEICRDATNTEFIAYSGDCGEWK